MYPEEEFKLRKLKLKCKICSYTCDADSAVVYVNKMKKDAENRLDMLDTDMASDPTLPRTFDTRCPKCKGKEAVFFMSRSGGKDSDMGLVFLCANDACLHKWLN
jgi:DNA-directed RNA polymerase II subunit RPB9